MSSKFHQYSIQIFEIRPIHSIHQLKEGTELIVAIANKTHHAVVTDVCHIKKSFEVIHLTCVNVEKGYADCQKLIMKFPSENYSMYDYGALSIGNGNVIKLRACILYKMFHTLNMLKDLKYNVFNCDHFASYCITGLAYSKLLKTHNENATKMLDRK